MPTVVTALTTKTETVDSIRRRKRRRRIFLTLFLAPKVIMFSLVVTQAISLFLQHPASPSTSPSLSLHTQPLLMLKQEFVARMPSFSRQSGGADASTTTTSWNESFFRDDAFPADFHLLPAFRLYQELYTTTNNNSTNATTLPLRYVCDMTSCGGGIGEQLLGIFHLFYHCLCLDRPIYIDWRRPFALQDFLEPNHIPWHVRPNNINIDDSSSTASWETLSMMMGNDNPQKNEPLLRDPHKLPATPLNIRVNQWVGEETIRNLPCLQRLNLFNESNSDHGSANNNLFRLAFWTLFRWSPLVLEASRRTRLQLALTKPYVGIHISNSSETETIWNAYYQCATKLQQRLQTKCLSRHHQLSPPPMPPLLFLASDTPREAKKFMKHLDASSSIRTLFADDAEMKKNASSLSAHDTATTQFFVDLLLLTKSTCLVTASTSDDHSTVSRMAQYLQERSSSCAVAWDDCSEATVERAVGNVNVQCHRQGKQD